MAARKKRRRWVKGELGTAPDPRNPKLLVDRRLMIDDRGRAFDYIGEITIGDVTPKRLPDPPDDDS